MGFLQKYACYFVYPLVLVLMEVPLFACSYFRSNTADKPERHQPKGFHENHIPVDGLTVAALCVERINSPHELSSNMKGEGQS